ncbi:MAG: hypothetical protein GXP51_12260, partial [Deltaproteobacteria bacterium]|nr:hypothetical protein [Deltaproteobacteria bacterium]
MLLRLFAVAIVLCCPLSAAAADWSRVGKSELPVNLEADELSYDEASGRYRASGNVQLTQGETEVRSRILWWNQVSGEIEAEG